MTRVDGKPVEPRGSWLDTCRAAGADVPTLCKDDRLGGGGHCRACLVEVDGRVVAACSTPAVAGANVLTDSEALRAYRRDLGELMLSECAPAGVVAPTLAAWGADGSRYGRAVRTDRRDHSHPLLRFEADRCILCRRCLRACEEIQGQFVFAIEGRGAQAHLAWGGGPFAETDCVACGACVTACPAGALTNADLDRAARLGPAADEHVTRTTCGYCGVGCALDVHVAGAGPAARIAHVEGAADSPVNHGHLCARGRFAHGFLGHPDRLTTPLVRRDGELRPASWDEALRVIADGCAQHRGHIAGIAGARCTNEEYYLFQKWLRGGLGTNDVSAGTPAPAGPAALPGGAASSASLADIELADLLLLAGSDATAAHPVAGARLRQAALRGTPLVVIGARRSELAALADVHLQPRPGTAAPLLHALASALVEDGSVDHAFVAAHADGWDAYRVFLAATTPESTEDVTGVPAALVRRAARMLGLARRPLLGYGIGLGDPLPGDATVALLVNLALLRGAFGREGAGVLALAGQNNAHGAADMGCRPGTTTGHAPVDDPATRASFAAAWGRPLPGAPGRGAAELLAAARGHELKVLFVLGEELLSAEPGATTTHAALAGLELLVVQDLFLTETAKRAHVVLPAASFLEKDGTFTSAERRVQRVRAVLAPPGEARPDWRILCDLMAATGWPQSYAGPAAILEEIARVAPPFAGLSGARLEPHGLQWPVGGADHPGTPRLRAEDYPRGRTAFTCTPFVPRPGAEHAFTLVAGRGDERYDAAGMTRRSGLGALLPAGELELHPADARALGLSEGALVRVRGAGGEFVARARYSGHGARGTLFIGRDVPLRDPAGPEGGPDAGERGEYRVLMVEVTRA